MIIVKIYLGISLELLWAVWGEFSFRQFLATAYTSQGLQAPSNVVSANYRLLLCTPVNSTAVPSVYFGFFCLLVSSVSNFCPDTRGQGGHFFRLPCSVVLWGGRNTANITGMCGSARSLWTTLGLPQLTVHVLSCSTLLRLQVALQGNCPKLVLGFVHLPGLSWSGSGSRVLHKGTDLFAHVFCAPPRSENLRRPGAW